MRNFLGSLLLLCGFLWLAPAHATVRINIDLSTQTMRIESARGSYTWSVSTARAGYMTPRGTFRPYSLQRTHFSRKYDNSPMPDSIFFAGGFAIHGTYETGALGRPASHGCVRLAPENAALLFQMVKEEGAVITISGTPPVVAGVHYYPAPAYAYPGPTYSPDRYNAGYYPYPYYPHPGGWQFPNGG